ncbi:flagellar basal-body MS-ring/collar protein FliF [Halomonas sp. LR5S13]|uniref:flagellar basal-body MS-ring/collar protein FliF n=1 Tax=Halomonas rhizosphaerae TaxID=3043296 RepID=UPI0024A9C004|nr:flagellar basal-body MS-ring/collar protein FliF [Halomonas rhizosphaerae]MDI5922798.1 flagellar basal-body MS-ring/collar protein FliF [Halomonas rhizosphaerae]
MSSGASATDSQASQGSAGITRLKEQLRGNPLVALLIAGAASIALIVALLMWASSPDYRVLYSNLSETDGGSIINELDTRGIPYRFSQGGQALLVPGDQVHTLRLQLAEQGLPQAGNVGFELMENQAFGISQFAEQINYQRGLEGELSRSMESLGPVNRARVHLALAKDSVFVRDREPAKASVVLTLHAGRTLGEGQVNSIVHMVSSSVPDLDAEAVTVVDQNGRLLTAPDANGLGLDGTQLDYIAEVERSYQQRIESILTPILGTQNVKAQVTAQVDFSRREETSERYGPNQPPNEAAVRSRQSSVSYNGNDDLAGGIPGALSNTPPGTATSPVENPPDEEDETDTEDEQADEDTLAATRNLNRDDVINYEVDRSISHVQHRRGQVERLSAAVVVNYRPTADDQGVMQPTPLSEVEIDQIERLVRQSMGFSQARGDEIAVVNSPFTRTDTEVEPLEWWQDPDVQQLAMTLGRYLLVGLAVLLLYLLILRPLVKRASQTPQSTAQPAPTFQTRVGEDDEERPSTSGEEDESTYNKPRRKRKASAYEDNLNDLREMAEEDPRMVAMIVRGWMNKND